ncbi:MAG: hypothetical protein MJ252_00380 [archaeon]|nr:hypothetical protein [archaeon]
MNGFFLFFLITLSFSQDTQKEKILVDYEKSLDVIKYGNKTYTPFSVESTSASFLGNEAKSFEEKKEDKAECEEELVRGGTMVFFMFMVAGKIILIKY